jgi:hypothetical protein
VSRWAFSSGRVGAWSRFFFDESSKTPQDGCERVAANRTGVAVLQVGHDLEAVEHQLPARAGELQDAGARIFRIAADADVAGAFEFVGKAAHRLFGDSRPIRRDGDGTAVEVDVGQQRRVGGAEVGIAASVQSLDDMPVHDARGLQQKLPHVSPAPLLERSRQNRAVSA